MSLEAQRIAEPRDWPFFLKNVRRWSSVIAQGDAGFFATIQLGLHVQRRQRWRGGGGHDAARTDLYSVLRFHQQLAVAEIGQVFACRASLTSRNAATMLFWSRGGRSLSAQGFPLHSMHVMYRTLPGNV